MYRRTLAALWAGAIIFGAGATADAFLDFMKNAQGVLIGAAATCFIGAILRIGFHELNETARMNGRRSEQLSEDVEQKTREVRGDVDQIRCQVTDLEGKVGEARDWAEAAALIKGSKPTPPEPDPTPEPEERDAVIYQFTVRGQHGSEAIVGSRTSDPVDADEVWKVLEANDVGTLPGRLRSS